MSGKLIVPAQPPPPTISKRSFQSVGSFTANLASGQMTPRTSQCSGRLPVAATSFADSTVTPPPNGIAANSSHCFTGAAKRPAEIERQTSAAFFILMNNTFSNRVKDQLRHAVQVQFFENISAVRLHRVEAEIENVRGFLVGPAFGEKLKNLALARSQKVVAVLDLFFLHAADVVLEQHLADDGAEKRFALGHGS